MSDSLDIPDFLRAVLDQIAVRESFSDFVIVLKPGSTVGDGFQGQLIRVTIEGRRAERTNDRLALICKIPPKSEIRRQFTANAFRQEIHVYERLLPELVQFQRDKGVGEEEGFFSFPKCYGTYSNETTLDYVIVLEDLCDSGYRMWNKYNPIDLAHVQLAIRELAKFHAISFALRDQKPQRLSELSKLNCSMYTSVCVPESLEFFKTCNDRAIDTLRVDDTVERRKMAEVRDNFVEVMRAASSGELAEPYAVLCHGDFWNNNMMFQYADAETSVPLKICLIDWQLVQYASPATDLSYFIYSSTEQSFRTDHFDAVVGQYHADLGTLLKGLGSDVDKQFTVDALQSQLRKFSVYAMTMAPLMVQVVTVKSEDIADLDAAADGNEEFDFMQNGVPAGYAVRMSDVIRDCEGRGYFGDELLELAKIKRNKELVD